MASAELLALVRRRAAARLVCALDDARGVVAAVHAGVEIEPAEACRRRRAVVRFTVHAARDLRTVITASATLTISAICTISSILPILTVLSVLAALAVVSSCIAKKAIDEAHVRIDARIEDALGIEMIFKSLY